MNQHRRFSMVRMLIFSTLFGFLSHAFADESFKCVVVADNWESPNFITPICFEKRGELPQSGAGLMFGIFAMANEKGAQIVPGDCVVAKSSRLFAVENKPAFEFTSESGSIVFVVDSVNSDGLKEGHVISTNNNDTEQGQLVFKDLDPVYTSAGQAAFSRYTDADLKLTCRSGL